MSDISRRIIFSAAVTAAACLLAVSCGKGKMRDRDLHNSLKTAIRQYESPVWTERLAAVKNVNQHLINYDRKNFFIEKKSKPYFQIAEDFLVEASSDLQPAVRIEAISGLVIIASKETSDRLIRMAEDDAESTVRWSALKALAFRAEPESADLFAKAYISEDWLVRETAVIGLLSIESVQVKRRYIQVIERAFLDKNISVRTAALSRLNFTDQRLYKYIVINLTGGHRNNRHTKATLKALSGYRLDEKMRNKIISDYLTHEDPEIRLLALKVLKTEQKLPQPPKKNK